VGFIYRLVDSSKDTIMNHLLAAGLVFSLALSFSAAGGSKKGNTEEVKEALQGLQDFIGGWKGNGTFADRSKTDIWKESADWSWRFKDKDVWLTLDMKDSKFYKTGEMRYLPAKGKYEFTLTDKKDKKEVYTGELKKGALFLERVDADKDTHQLKMNTAGGGVRLILAYAVKPDGRTAFNQKWSIGYTKEGESFGTSAKKTECCVTGGLGTMAVTYNGATYYVCCSGCRDAFNENPAKIIKEYLARKKAGK